MKNLPLPPVWVDKLFFRLQGIYGQGFLNQFMLVDSNGNDIGIGNAKQVWAEELGGFSDNPEAIAYALSNLPERMPNVIQFREICRRAPRKEPVMLEHHISDEERARNKQRIRELVEKFGGTRTS